MLDAALGLFLEHGYEEPRCRRSPTGPGSPSPSSTPVSRARTSLFRALLAREEERIIDEIQAAFRDADLTDPEATLIEGFTGFLRAVDHSPDVYRLIFLGEGGGNMAVAHRIQRGREAQIDQLSTLAMGWVEARGGSTPKAEIERTARLLGYAIAGLAETGARLLLSEPEGWTPETLGRELGRLAADAQATV